MSDSRRVISPCPMESGLRQTAPVILSTKIMQMPCRPNLFKNNYYLSAVFGIAAWSKNKKSAGLTAGPALICYSGNDVVII